MILRRYKKCKRFTVAEVCRHAGVVNLTCGITREWPSRRLDERIEISLGEVFDEAKDTTSTYELCITPEEAQQLLEKLPKAIDEVANMRREFVVDVDQSGKLTTPTCDPE